MTKKRAIKLLLSFGYSREQAAYERVKFELCRDIPCRQTRNMRLCKLPAN